MATVQPEIGAVGGAFARRVGPDGVAVTQAPAVRKGARIEDPVRVGIHGVGREIGDAEVARAEKHLPRRIGGIQTEGGLVVFKVGIGVGTRREFFAAGGEGRLLNGRGLVVDQPCGGGEGPAAAVVVGSGRPGPAKGEKTVVRGGQSAAVLGLCPQSAEDAIPDGRGGVGAKLVGLKAHVIGVGELAGGAVGRAIQAEGGSQPHLGGEGRIVPEVDRAVEGLVEHVPKLHHVNDLKLLLVLHPAFQLVGPVDAHGHLADQGQGFRSPVASRPGLDGGGLVRVDVIDDVCRDAFVVIKSVVVGEAPGPLAEVGEVVAQQGGQGVDVDGAGVDEDFLGQGVGVAAGRIGAGRQAVRDRQEPAVRRVAGLPRLDSRGDVTEIVGGKPALADNHSGGEINRTIGGIGQRGDLVGHRAPDGVAQGDFQGVRAARPVGLAPHPLHVDQPLHVFHEKGKAGRREVRPVGRSLDLLQRVDRDPGHRRRGRPPEGDQVGEGRVIGPEGKVPRKIGAQGGEEVRNGPPVISGQVHLDNALAGERAVGIQGVACHAGRAEHREIGHRQAVGIGGCVVLRLGHAKEKISHVVALVGPPVGHHPLPEGLQGGILGHRQLDHHLHGHAQAGP